MEYKNNEDVIKTNLKKEKPCKKCGYCPYGIMVEESPLVHGELSCKHFGHDCPMYYYAEDVTEDKKSEILKTNAKAQEEEFKC